MNAQYYKCLHLKIELAGNGIQFIQIKHRYFIKIAIRKQTDTQIKHLHFNYCEIISLLLSKTTIFSMFV